MTHFFKRIKFRYYILICISSPLVCILYRKGDNIQISILICILSPFLCKKHSKGTIYRLVYSVLITTCTVSTFMLKGTVYKVPYLTHLYIFTLSPKNNQAPFFLYISPKGIPFLKTLTWSNIIKHLTKYMMYFFKRIKFRNYILICISSPWVCILYRKRGQYTDYYINLYIVPFPM